LIEIAFRGVIFIEIAFRGVIFKGDVPAFSVAKIGQPTPEVIPERSIPNDADAGNLSLLRVLRTAMLQPRRRPA
jgi:hypothetical protein